MRVRILHVSQPADGGVARVVASLARDQTSRGWDVTVACPASGPLGDWVGAAGARWVAWEARRGPGLGTLGETRRLHAVVEAARPHVVHLHSSKAGLAGRILLRGALPTLFQPHAWSFEAAGGPLRRGAVAWERRGARWADRVVCVSHAEREAGERAGVRARWEIVPNGVDVSTYRPADAADARRRLGLPDAPLVVCVGRLTRQKGQDVLLRAWPAVLARVPGARLVLVGDGPDRTRLAVISGPGVRFAGDRDDVAEWLAAADVVVAPSRWEGMALAVLEAMACGRSVVATDVAGMGEALGSCGALLPPAEAEPLAAAIAARLADPELRAEEGRLARARVMDRFTVGRATDEIAAITVRVLAERRRHGSVLSSA